MGAEDAFAADTGGLNSELPTDEFLYAVNISTQYRYIYVETPKCACSTVKFTLRRLELGDPNFEFADVRNVHLREHSPLLNPKQVGSFTSLINDDRFVKFCFVRHPFTRLLSAYLDKIERGRPPKADILSQLGMPPEIRETPVSFADFVRVVVEQPVRTMNPHWRTQYYQTMQTAIPYDFVGRFERFNEDFHAIGDKLSPDFQQFFVEVRGHATNASAQIDRYFTDALKELVYRKFKIDFDHFGYRPI